MDTIPHSVPIKEGSWFDLSDTRAVFRLSGPDRVRFLNGQVSNNVDVDLSGKSIPACLCNLKGKVEFLVWITADGSDALLIDGEISQRELLFERLGRYLIADDCELEDVTEDWQLVHRLGVEASVRDEIASNRTGIEGVDCWIRTGDAFGFDAESQLHREDWEKISVLHGVPEAGYELTGSEFPSELRLDTWAVDFRKGCYLGQEIVSRIQSVGQTKRNLYLFVTNKSKEKGEVIAMSGVEIGKSTRKSVQIEKNIWVTLAFLKSFAVDSLLTDNEENREMLFLPRNR